ncbi:MAG: AAA family ATPase [Pirellulaceae bacterium]
MTGNGQSSTFDLARKYVAAGLSVLPIATDGTKGPDWRLLPRRGNGEGQLSATWLPLQERLPTGDELRKWYGPAGIGVIGGKVSGNLEILDIDDGELVEPFKAAVEAEAPGLLDRLPQSQTPRDGGGLHIFYRSTIAPPGNSKLAKSEPRPQFNSDGEPNIDRRTGEQRLAPETLIETRGEGGYVVAPGSPGKCHKTGREYRHVGGPPITGIPIISAVEREILLSVAQSFNRHVDQKPAGEANGKPRDGLAPGDSFNQQATTETILDLLASAGWTVCGSTGDVMRVRRPGKSCGISGTVGLVSKSGNVQFCCFSSNAHPFEGAGDGRSCSTYSAFAVYATINHGGDFSAAARALQGKGYGDQRPARQDAGQFRREPQQQQPAITYKLMTSAELDAATFDIEFLVEWLLVAMQPLILFGPQKALKTSILLDLLLSLASGGKFLGYFNVTRAVRCLVMTGESGMGVIQETARRQCKGMGIELAQVGNLLWSEDLPRFGSIAHQDALARTLTENEIEVVAIDPAYLTMPGGDAGNLMMQGELLRGVSEVCRACGCMMILVHHSRKNRVDAHEPLELSDLAWSGFAEFARQWIGVNRNRPYRQGTGEHDLWLQYGGSAGHGGLHGLKIREGITSGSEGRFWDVSVMTEQEAREQTQETAADARREKREQQFRKDVENAKEAIEGALRSADGNRDSKSQLRDRCGKKGKAFDEAIGELLRTGRLEHCKIERSNRQTYDGFKLKFKGEK